jgi:hypothetical protein
LGSELIPVSDSYIGFGSDFPYLWLKAISDDTPSVPVHIAIDAPGKPLIPNFTSIYLIF